jgi:hypothetical protein
VPTARELLDQADALMRRNRPAAGAADEGIPTLTDAVPPAQPGTPREAPSARALVRGDAANDLDDVPLLTDAVEEIEAPSILEEPPDEGDPEAWDDTLTGAHTIIPAAPLELPEQPAPSAPAAVGVLPEEWGATPPAHAGPTLAVETIEIPPPRADVAEPVAVEPPGHREPPASTDETVPNVVAAMPDETQPATPFEWPASAAPAHPVGIYQAPAAHEAPAPAAPLAVSAHAAADDEARWSALAEEIRMQVLQRIDLFTDTGLREQLAARLQPIVDRASADLVATINQHVGVLLRAYVAEAIEREIERWRAEGR